MTSRPHRGQTAAEYAGTLVLVAVIMVALVGTGVGDAIVGAFRGTYETITSASNVSSPDDTGDAAETGGDEPGQVPDGPAGPGEVGPFSGVPGTGAGEAGDAAFVRTFAAAPGASDDTYPYGVTGRSRTYREVDGARLRVRGRLSNSCLSEPMTYSCSSREYNAQSLAINWWSQQQDPRSMLPGQLISDDIDWEVRGSRRDGYPSKSGDYRADIVTHRRQGEWLVSEVKRYDKPDRWEDVENQLNQYQAALQTYANENADRNTRVGRDNSFMDAGDGTGVIGVFHQGGDDYVVWSPQPGHIYFERLDDLRDRARDGEDVPEEWQVDLWEVVDQGQRYVDGDDTMEVEEWDSPSSGSSCSFCVPVPPLPLPAPTPILV